MKLIEALNILLQSSVGIRGEVRGFPGLWVYSASSGNSARRSITGGLNLSAVIKISTGLYGDFMGNLERVAESGPDAAAGGHGMAVVDLDPRLGVRSLGGWLPDVLPNIIENVRVRFWLQLKVHSRGFLTELPVVACFPTLGTSADIPHSRLASEFVFEMEVCARAVCAWTAWFAYQTSKS